VGSFLVFSVCGVWFNLQHSNIFCGLFCMHVALILIFETYPVSGYVCAFQCILVKVCLLRRCNNCHSHMECCTHTASSAGHLHRSSFHQYLMQCMFSFENDPEIETVPDASEFLRNTRMG
jgi:hypothetical protein